MIAKGLPMTTRRWRWPRWTLLFGFAAPAIVAAGVLVASVRNRAVNPIHQSISLLMDGPGRDLLEASLLVAGGCVLWTAWAMFRGVSHGVSLALSQGILGLGVMATGAFMQHHLPRPHQWAVPSPWGPLTPVGLVHVAAATVLYAALVGTCAAVLARARGRAVKGLAFGTGIALVLLLALFLVTAVLHGPSGLFERLVAAVGIGWEYGFLFIVWHWF
ncbi:MAG: DUF998 domain-containing protein [Firmicutes bacterium]|nr:DUF998 domain-containing protein [Bacillota bacterium]